MTVTESSTRRKQLQAKIDRAHAVRIKAEQFIGAGGELNSQEAGGNWYGAGTCSSRTGP